MEKEDKEIEPRFGIVNLERRRHPGLLSIYRSNTGKSENFKSCPSRATNLSEGGLLVFLSGASGYWSKFATRSIYRCWAQQLNCIEAVVEGRLKDIHVGKTENIGPG